MEFFKHGSADSLDNDMHFVVESLSPIKYENKQRCDALSLEYNVNGNIITIDRKLQVVSGSFKGCPDEVNNALLATHGLHTQEFECPVKQKLERDPHMKMLRVIRGILSQCSRTKHRVEIKKALRAENIFTKLEVLETLPLRSFSDFGSSKMSAIDVRKFIAFQTIQFLGLIRHVPVEVYTKAHAVALYGNRAHQFLYRDPTQIYNLDIIDDMQDALVQGCYALIDSKKTLNILQDGKLLRTKFGRLNMKSELYEADE